MAAVAENAIRSDDQFLHRPSPSSAPVSAAAAADPKSEFQHEVRKLVDLLSKLNPSAKEFFPSSYSVERSQNDLAAAANKDSSSDGSSNSNRRKKNNYNHWKRRSNGRSIRAQREDSVRRTVYVADIDQHVTEERLAALFDNCGQVVDCRICGDPHSVLRFAFVEFADEQGAMAALSLAGTMLGFYPVRVLPSKTAILPVNPTFLPRSEDEREMCARTVYCTNIDKKSKTGTLGAGFSSRCKDFLSINMWFLAYGFWEIKCTQHALHLLSLFWRIVPLLH
ncbi:polyadenylate-binding protein-interacting protein 8-like isoform X2 [Magnolia sinica]|uniref:polyadenylate-binding protein-interacting protein 8-like isoform X2 n=1 Tax=Magnolia sinica TaxID=86752 RepID=UPI0026581C43|nr:polyadenylate-binding protein-interacting protein 8-like isoform X2 [Magnolia sinica]